MYFDENDMIPQVWLIERDGTFRTRILRVESLDIVYSAEGPSTLKMVSKSDGPVMRLQRCDGNYLINIRIRNYDKVFFPVEFHHKIEQGLDSYVEVSAVCGLPAIRDIFLGQMNPSSYVGNLSAFLRSDMITSATAYSRAWLMLSLTDFRGHDPQVRAAFSRKTFGQFFDEVGVPNNKRLISEQTVVKASTIKNTVFSYNGGDAIWPVPVIFTAGERDKMETPVVSVEAGHVAELDIVNFPDQATLMLSEVKGELYAASNNDDLSKSIWASRTDDINMSDFSGGVTKPYIDHLNMVLTSRGARQEYRLKVSDSVPIKLGDPNKQRGLFGAVPNKYASAWVREGNNIELRLSPATSMIREITSVHVSWQGDRYEEEFTLSDSSTRPRDPGYMNAEDTSKLAGVMRRG